ncbi:MAG: response regulator transcription factor [Treponema sp.]|nr:response regulator transcription factor [Treponema sp.]
MSANTVKYHLKNIYSKLGASSATQAVWEARVRGLI